MAGPLCTRYVTCDSDPLDFVLNPAKWWCPVLRKRSYDVGRVACIEIHSRLTFEDCYVGLSIKTKHRYFVNHTTCRDGSMRINYWRWTQWLHMFRVDVYAIAILITKWQLSWVSVKRISRSMRYNHSPGEGVSDCLGHQYEQLLLAVLVGYQDHLSWATKFRHCPLDVHSRCRWTTWPEWWHRHLHMLR